MSAPSLTQNLPNLAARRRSIFSAYISIYFGIYITAIIAQNVQAEAMESMSARVNAYSYQETADKIIAQGRLSPHKMLFELYKDAAHFFDRKKLRGTSVERLQNEATPAVIGKDPNGYLLWLPIHEGKPLRVADDKFTIWIGIYRTMPEGVVWKVECAMVSSPVRIRINRKYDVRNIQSVLHPIWQGALRLHRVHKLTRENGMLTDLMIVAGNIHPIDNVEEAFGFRIDMRFRNSRNYSLTAYSGITRKQN